MSLNHNSLKKTKQKKLPILTPVTASHLFLSLPLCEGCSEPWQWWNPPESRRQRRGSGRGRSDGLWWPGQQTSRWGPREAEPRRSSTATPCRARRQRIRLHILLLLLFDGEAWYQSTSSIQPVMALMRAISAIQGRSIRPTRLSPSASHRWCRPWTPACWKQEYRWPCSPVGPRTKTWMRQCNNVQHIQEHSNCILCHQSQNMYQNNSCSWANEGVEESALKRQPAARQEEGGGRILMFQLRRRAFWNTCRQRRGPKMPEWDSLVDGAVSLRFCEAHRDSHHKCRKAWKWDNGRGGHYNLNTEKQTLLRKVMQQRQGGALTPTQA